MTLKIVIEEKARVDIIDAEKWYFEKSVIAAENFKKEITEAINSLNKTITEHRKVFFRSQTSFIENFSIQYLLYKRHQNNFDCSCIT